MLAMNIFPSLLAMAQ